MAKFNRGKPYHGSSAVEDGKLTGATDTDYFYFLCPKCPDKEIMRVLEYEVRAHQNDNPYNEFFKRKAVDGFILTFHLYCENCKHEDFTKISNMGWQGGRLGGAFDSTAQLAS